jgi:hypothetical protein
MQHMQFMQYMQDPKDLVIHVGVGAGHEDRVLPFYTKGKGKELKKRLLMKILISSFTRGLTLWETTCNSLIKNLLHCEKDK